MADERSIADESVPGLARQLHDPDPDVRLEAAERLLSRAPIGTGSPMRRPILTPRETRDALSVLIDVVRGDERSDVRALAVNGIGVFACEESEGLDVLIDALADSSAEVRTEAASALGEVRGAAERIVGALGRALADGSSDVRLAAAVALEARAPDVLDATDALVAALADENVLVGQHAARALKVAWEHARRDPILLAARLAGGPRSASVLWLIESLGGADPEWLIDAIDHPATRASAIRALAERDADVLERGLRRLAQVAPMTFDDWLLRGDQPVWRPGSERIWTGALTAIAREAPVTVRRTAVAALPAVERSLRIAVLLEALSRDSNPDVREAAVTARDELLTILGLHG